MACQRELLMHVKLYVIFLNRCAELRNSIQNSIKSLSMLTLGHTNGTSTNSKKKIMHEVKIYARDKNGNRGPLISTIKYPTAEQATRAKAAIIWLCANQWKFSKEWKLKRTIVI